MLGLLTYYIHTNSNYYYIYNNSEKAGKKIEKKKF